MLCEQLGYIDDENIFYVENRKNDVKYINSSKERSKHEHVMEAVCNGSTPNKSELNTMVARNVDK
jgi:hypothetical protein